MPEPAASVALSSRVAAAPATARNTSRNTSRAAASKKKKKLRIMEDAAMVRRLVEHAQAGQAEHCAHLLQMEGEPRLDLEAGAGESLVAAAEAGQTDCITALVQLGGNVNCLSGRPLQRACLALQLPAASLLLSLGADPAAAATLTLFTPLMMACMQQQTTAAGSSSSCSAVLPPQQAPPAPQPVPGSNAAAATSGASPPAAQSLTSEPPTTIAVSRRLSLVRLLLSYPSCWRGLGSGCSALYCGPYCGWSALHFACDCGDADVVSELLRCGADVEASTAQGDSALSIAAERGHAQCVRLLLAEAERRPQLSRPRRGLQAADWAAHRGDAELLRFLIAAGATDRVQPQLQAELQSALSETMLDRLQLHRHRGAELQRQRRTLRDELLLCCWQTTEPAATGGAVPEDDSASQLEKGVNAFFPSAAIDLIVEYEL